MNVSTLTVWKFWTKFIPDPKPDNPLYMRQEDWVEYGPIGARDRTVVQSPVRSVIDKLQPMTNRGNPAIVMAHERAAIIRRAYEAWKAGNEVPLDGTPLAAWNGISPEQAEIFKSNNIRTVQEIALLNDALMGRIPIPNLRQLIVQAQAFVASADQVLAAKQMTELEGKNAALVHEVAEQREQIAALMTSVKQLIARQSELEPVLAEAGEPALARRRRGRPPKQHSVVEPEAAA